ncbi:MAG: hypothetical protein AB7K71_21845 [Polyangiaceae bacterium]
MTIHYAVGMELALPTPGAQDLGIHNRETLLASVVHQVALTDEYQLRVILPWDAPVECPHDVNEGEMLFLVAEAEGGPLAKEQATSVIARVDELGRDGELPDQLGPVFIGPMMDASRMLILPPHCMTQLSETHTGNPLCGVAYVSAAEMRKLLAELGEVDVVQHLRALLDLAIAEHLVLSARIAD